MFLIAFVLCITLHAPLPLTILVAALMMFSAYLRFQKYLRKRVHEEAVRRFNESDNLAEKIQYLQIINKTQ